MSGNRTHAAEAPIPETLAHVVDGLPSPGHHRQQMEADRINADQRAREAQREAVVDGGPDGRGPVRAKPVAQPDPPPRFRPCQAVADAACDQAEAAARETLHDTPTDAAGKLSDAEPDWRVLARTQLRHARARVQAGTATSHDYYLVAEHAEQERLNAYQREQERLHVAMEMLDAEEEGNPMERLAAILERIVPALTALADALEGIDASLGKLAGHLR